MPWPTPTKVSLCFMSASLKYISRVMVPPDFSSRISFALLMVSPSLMVLEKCAAKVRTTGSAAGAADVLPPQAARAKTIARARMSAITFFILCYFLSFCFLCYVLSQTCTSSFMSHKHKRHLRYRDYEDQMDNIRKEERD